MFGKMSVNVFVDYLLGLIEVKHHLVANHNLFILFYT